MKPNQLFDEKYFWHYIKVYPVDITSRMNELTCGGLVNYFFYVQLILLQDNFDIILIKP